VLLHFAQTNEFVAALEAGIALQEKLHSLSVQLFGSRQCKMRFEMAARLDEFDHAGLGIVVIGKHVERQSICQRLEVASINAPMRKERLPEYRQIPECAVTFDEEETNKGEHPAVHA